MQEYLNQEVIDKFYGTRDALEERGKADIASGKTDRYVIGELPKKGMTLIINDLKFIVFSATEGGTVVLRLQGAPKRA